ncbi:CAP domain-containing protein [Nocardia sp. CDC159]|uniref:CAP domain-containing protein n=1 Tax=Nocardia pulmonis TaxID=2951408 RepID=A0A9X2IYR0_9NOCA|nr:MULTISPECIES: CAP domain-containing protein [Nocardia]MCM6775270.1 CAP domain-containing protein [Nocardia pulmonis]MCM6787996.1 CAP domain-containing protein [Nocardia sp. CDC159]
MSKIWNALHEFTGRRSRAALGAVCVMVVVTGGAMSGPAVAAPDKPGTGTVESPNGRWPVNLRSGPSLRSAKVGRARHRDRVTIVCTTRGERVESRWGATDIWDKLDSGRWISDAFVDTGTNEPAAPDCGGGDTKPPKPSEPQKPDQPTKPDEPAPAPGAVEGEAAWEKQVLDLFNAERRKKGCQPLRVDERLTRAARLHNKDMRDRRFFDHFSPDGRDWEQRARAQGYQGEVSENIGMGAPDPREIMNGWMSSPGHRENLLNCSWKSTGIGALKGNPRRGNSLLDQGPWWTAMFGAR